MAAESVEFKVCPSTSNILLDATTGYFEDCIRNKDVTAQVVSALIQKIGVGNQIKVGGGKSLWSITITDDSVMDVSVVTKKDVATKKKAISKKLAEEGPVCTTNLPELILSPALQKVVGKGPMPRSEIVTKLWQYIKANELQDKVQRRNINCNPALKKVFGKDTLSMFEMAGLIGKHLTVVK